MYNITAFAGDYENHYLQAELAVVSAGSFLMDTFDSSSYRPDGLPDYQIVYIHKGVCHLTLEHKIEVSAGNIVVFKPGEPQIYEYHEEDKSEVLWVHFTGTEVANILEKMNLYDKKIFPVYNGLSLKKGINDIIDELKTKSSLYETAVVGRLLSILVEISRNENESSVKNTSTINWIIRKIEKNFNDSKTNSDYANECNMSTSHFLASFKKITGTSPQQYKIHCKIENSKKILVNSNLSIRDIAYAVGFEDVPYFCKYFKKVTGSTPSDYRNNNNS